GPHGSETAREADHDVTTRAGRKRDRHGVARPRELATDRSAGRVLAEPEDARAKHGGSARLARRERRTAVVGVVAVVEQIQGEVVLAEPARRGRGFPPATEDDAEITGAARGHRAERV